MKGPDAITNKQAYILFYKLKSPSSKDKSRDSSVKSINGENVQMRDASERKNSHRKRNGLLLNGSGSSPLNKSMNSTRSLSSHKQSVNSIDSVNEGGDGHRISSTTSEYQHFTNTRSPQTNQSVQHQNLKSVKSEVELRKLREINQKRIQDFKQSFLAPKSEELARANQMPIKQS